MQLTPNVLEIPAVKAVGGDPAGYHLPKWSPAASEAFLDANGGAIAILSLSAPGPSIAGNQQGARQLARKANDYMAEIRDSSPERFGFFGAIPDGLDTAGTIEEIAYALDVLKADGITIFTRYGDGNYYLGHKAFLPLWEELNRRRAVVFIHPTHAVDTTPVNARLHGPGIDYPHETTRTAVDMIMSRTLQKHPKVKVILSHAGGNLPWIIPRLALAVRGVPPRLSGGVTYEEWMGGLRRFYYDLALSSSKQGLELLLKAIPHDHILYGKSSAHSVAFGHTLASCGFCFCFCFTAKTQHTSDTLPKAPTSPTQGPVNSRTFDSIWRPLRCHRS